MEGLGDTLLARTLHCKRRSDEAELGEEFGRARPASLQYPSDFRRTSGNVRDERRADTAPATLGADGNHRQVAIAEAVRDGARKPDNSRV